MSTMTHLAAENADLRQQLEEALEGGARAFQDSMDIHDSVEYRDMLADAVEMGAVVFQDSMDVFNENVDTVLHWVDQSNEYRAMLSEATTQGAEVFQDSIDIAEYVDLWKSRAAAETESANGGWLKAQAAHGAYVDLLEVAEDLFNQTMSSNTAPPLGWRELADNYGSKVDATVNGARSEEYGPSNVMLDRIADFWSTLFKRHVTAEMVAEAYILGKIARGMNKMTPDSILDIGGYAKTIADYKAAHERRVERANYGWTV